MSGLTADVQEKFKREVEKKLAELPPPKATPGEEHVIWDGSAAGASALVCTHCGERHAIAWPIELKMLDVTLRGFAKLHRKCKFRPNKEHDRQQAALSLATLTPDEWINGADSGVSSATIWSVLSGRPMPRGWAPDVPYDPSDFGRCYRLLKRVEGWRARLPEVAERFPEWRLLVGAWEELTALYEAELPTGNCPATYARMKQLEAMR